MKKFTMFFSLCFGIIFMTQAQQKTGSQSSGTSSRQTESEISSIVTNNLTTKIQTNENYEKKDRTDESPYAYAHSFNVEQKRELLRSKHHAFLGLPYPKDYIVNTVMPSLQAGRNIVAPNFPLRSSDVETDKNNMSLWLGEYTTEFIQYLIFLDDMYDSLLKSVSE